MKKCVTPEMEKIWIERYLKGETIRNIAKDFPIVTESTVGRYIKKAGISRGNSPYRCSSIKEQVIKEYQNDHYATCSSLGKKYNLYDGTISKWLKEAGIPIKQKSGYISKTQQEYFKQIDTPSKAYLLGFITADGALTGKKQYNYPTSCSIEIHEKDKELIDFAKKEINPEASVTPCNYQGKHNIKVSFSGKEFCSYLMQYGIVQNKSKIIQKVPKEQIPKELLSYYFRGLIDGDGCILKDGRTSIYSGSYNFISSVQDILCSEIGLSKLKIYKGTTYFVSWSSKKDRQKLYNYLYKDKLNQAFYYKRKFERLHNSLYDNTVITN